MNLWVAAGQHKNGSARSAPLNQAAMDVLERRQGGHSTHVFTYEGNPVVQVNTKAWAGHSHARTATLRLQENPING
jgi:hypothetical protein